MDPNNSPTQALGTLEGFNFGATLHWSPGCKEKTYMCNKIRSFSSIPKQGARTDHSAQHHSWPRSGASFKEKGSFLNAPEVICSSSTSAIQRLVQVTLPASKRFWVELGLEVLSHELELGL